MLGDRPGHLEHLAPIRVRTNAGARSAELTPAFSMCAGVSASKLWTLGLDDERKRRSGPTHGTRCIGTTSRSASSPSVRAQAPSLSQRGRSGNARGVRAFGSAGLQRECVVVRRTGGGNPATGQALTVRRDAIELTSVRGLARLCPERGDDQCLRTTQRRCRLGRTLIWICRPRQRRRASGS